MEFNEVIKNRRSIRQFDKVRKVEKYQIEQVIQAAIYAPTWKNSQTARYYCAVEDDAINKVSDCLQGTNKEKSSGAALIVTTFVHNRSGFDRDGNPDNECGNGWGYYDLGLACENLVLKAHEMGLGTLIMGIRNGEMLREVLDIPESETVVAVIAIGYPDIDPEMPKRKMTDDVITWI